MVAEEAALGLISAFALTIISEFLVVWAFIQKDAGRILLYDFLINLFTWPIAVYLYWFGVNVYIVEVGVVLAESILLMKLFELKYRKSLLISISANTLSFVLGLFVFNFLQIL